MAVATSKTKQQETNRQQTKSKLLTTEKVDDIIKRENLGETIPRHEKLWFKNQIGVRKSGIPFGMTDNEVEEYGKCKLSVHYFAEKYCKIKLSDGTIGNMKLREYQKDIIDLYIKNRFSILMASRQTGKTISAAIVILHFMLFNNDKGVMIVANKGATVIEIVDKIKSIYQYLPFFLKKGVINWNNNSLTFENGCRLKTDKKSKTPAIGFTIDLLYFDEFAHVDSNIIESYYGAAVPIVSSIENSKIIITSTPKGYNLFYKLLMGAEKKEGDPDKNPYVSLRVYWWQVNGRRDTKFIPSKLRMEKYGVKFGEIKEILEKEYGYELYTKVLDGKKEYYIKYFSENEKTLISSIRQCRINKIPLAELGNITNWKEEQTKLIGGEAMFRQEFGIEFITGDKLLFDEVEMEKIVRSEEYFSNYKFNLLDKKLSIPYDRLEFLKDRPDLFLPQDMKKYYIAFSLDLGEGLGQDYTVINIFRIMMKDEDIIKNHKHKFVSKYDYLKLEQIGMFRSNIYSISEVAQLFYVLFFEIFDPEKCKGALEYNTYGAEFLSQCQRVFDGNNNYGDAIFARYKHKMEDKSFKIGFKVSKANKVNLLIKNFQQNQRKQNILLHNFDNIIELKTFAKVITPAGNFTFRSETGNDDCVMSTISVSTLYETISFKNLLDIFISNELKENDRKLIENLILEKDDGSMIDYGSLLSAKKSLGTGSSYNPNGFTRKTTIWNPSPFNRNF